MCGHMCVNKKIYIEPSSRPSRGPLFQKYQKSTQRPRHKAPLRAMLAPEGGADWAPEGPPGVHLAAGQGIWWRTFTTTNALWI